MERVTIRSPTEYTFTCENAQWNLDTVRELCNPIMFWSVDERKLIRNLTDDEHQRLAVGDYDLLPDVGLVQVVDITGWQV